MSTEKEGPYLNRYCDFNNNYNQKSDRTRTLTLTQELLRLLFPRGRHVPTYPWMEDLYKSGDAQTVEI